MSQFSKLSPSQSIESNLVVLDSMKPAVVEKKIVYNSKNAGGVVGV